jgi:hypothetical protein
VLHIISFHSLCSCKIPLSRSPWNRPQPLGSSVLGWSLLWPGKRAISIHGIFLIISIQCRAHLGLNPHLKSRVGVGHLMGMQPPKYTEFIVVQSSSGRKRLGAKPFHMRILIDPLSKKFICFRMLNHGQSRKTYLCSVLYRWLSPLSITWILTNSMGQSPSVVYTFESSQHFMEAKSSLPQSQELSNFRNLSQTLHNFHESVLFHFDPVHLSYIKSQLLNEL